MLKAKEPGMAAKVYFVQTLAMSVMSFSYDRIHILGNQGGLAEDGKQNAHVQRRTPDPKT
jgi:hypothetical protein